MGWGRKQVINFRGYEDKGISLCFLLASALQYKQLQCDTSTFWEYEQVTIIDLCKVLQRNVLIFSNVHLTASTSINLSCCVNPHAIQRLIQLSSIENSSQKSYFRVIVCFTLGVHILKGLWDQSITQSTFTGEMKINRVWWWEHSMLSMC